MLVHDKVRERTETQEAQETSGVESSTPNSVHAAVRSSGRKPARWGWGLATAALVGVATLAAVTQSDQGTDGEVAVSDGSFEVAEEARMRALRDMLVTPGEE